jgi:hypothetical protein
MCCAPMLRSRGSGGAELEAEEETCRTLRQRLEQMGPVNMMALDEYKETAERHAFLEAQRTDLIESIENTQETIKRNRSDFAYQIRRGVHADQRRTSAPCLRASFRAARPCCA